MSTGSILAVNGIVIFLIGQLNGIPFGRSLSSKRLAARAEQWKLAHSSITAGGVGIIAFGAACETFALTGNLTHWMSALLIVSGYSFVLATWLAALTGERGLVSGGSRWNRAVFWLYILASTTSLGGTIAGGVAISLR